MNLATIDVGSSGRSVYTPSIGAAHVSSWEGRSMSRIREAAAQIVRPLQEFTQTETTGGVLLLAAACVALVWINLPNDSYIHFWARHVDINLD
ncbi:MAG: hypothetical protein EPO22_05290, partial [Dehalococcoidia bacterium]